MTGLGSNFGFKDNLASSSCLCWIICDTLFEEGSSEGLAVTFIGFGGIFGFVAVIGSGRSGCVDFVVGKTVVDFGLKKQ